MSISNKAVKAILLGTVLAVTTIANQIVQDFCGAKGEVTYSVPHHRRGEKPVVLVDQMTKLGNGFSMDRTCAATLPDGATDYKLTTKGADPNARSAFIGYKDGQPLRLPEFLAERIQPCENVVFWYNLMMRDKTAAVGDEFYKFKETIYETAFGNRKVNDLFVPGTPGKTIYGNETMEAFEAIDALGKPKHVILESKEGNLRYVCEDERFSALHNTDDGQRFVVLVGRGGDIAVWDIVRKDGATYTFLHERKFGGGGYAVLARAFAKIPLPEGTNDGRNFYEVEVPMTSPYTPKQMADLAAKVGKMASDYRLGAVRIDGAPPVSGGNSIKADVR